MPVLQINRVFRGVDNTHLGLFGGIIEINCRGIKHEERLETCIDT